MMEMQMSGSIVTVVFTELVGAAAPFERDAADAVRRTHLDALRARLAAHGGREVTSTGDCLMVTFGGAVAAVRCAIEMQRAVSALGRLQLSVGIDAGEPLTDGDDLYGTPVTIASRLCDAAEPGEILVSDVVARIAGPRAGQAMQPLGVRRLRGIAERLAVTRIRWDAADEPTPLAPLAPARMVNVVIADDEQLVRSGFRVILENEPDIRVIGEAADGTRAVDVVRRTRPDVVLMDIRMPALDGLSAAERILGDPGLDTHVVMLTTFDRDEYIYEALRIGASGFLLKDAPEDQLVAAIRVAADGGALFSPTATQRLIERFAGHADPPAGLSDLTDREREVLTLVARGLSNAEIAGELVVSEHTVKTHVARILQKLDLRDRTQAVVAAYESGLVQPGLL
jgi:DNA-binding NarL/FixJ family response regulator/class 3 adenylate cyclase